MDQNLLVQLEFIREKMIRSGMENGLQAPKTIRLSKKLDEMLNLYDKINKTSFATKK